MPTVLVIDDNPAIATASRTNAARSSSVNNGCFAAFVATATTTRSNIREARWITSRWPFVNGSKLPG